MESRWPAARPESDGHAAFLASDSERAVAFIAARADYAALVRGQERLDELELELVDLDRRTAQIEKLLRSRMLARALEQIERHGSDRDRAAYWSLRECEALPLGGRATSVP
jgi:hypothetical protein